MGTSLFAVPSQADRRRTLTAEDQHGRRWEFVIELKTGEPCSTFTPKFDAPWYPPNEALKRDANNDARLVIDYAMLLRNARRAIADYQSELRSWALRLPNIEDVEEAVKNPTLAMLDIVGQGPQPIQLCYAASIGNRWALGFDKAVPKWALPFITDRSRALAEQFPEIEGSDAVAARKRAVEQSPPLDDEETAELRELVGVTIEGDDEGPKMPARGPGGRFLPNTK